MCLIILILSSLLSKHKIEGTDVVEGVGFEVAEVDFDFIEIAKNGFKN